MVDAEEYNMLLTLPPSAANRWYQCPGSAALEKVYGVRRESKYALEGTRAHEIAAKAIRGEVLPYPLPEWCTEDMLYYAEVYREFIQSIRDSGEVIAELIETKLDTGRSFGTSKASNGYVDFAALIRHGNGMFTLWGVDYKYGRGYKESPYYNRQLISYARAVMDKWAIAPNSNVTVKLAIHQPRIREKPYIWELAIGEYTPEVSKTRTAVNRTGAGFEVIKILEARPSVSACHFCSVKTRCKGLRMELNDIFAAYQLENFTGDPALIHDLVASNDINELAALVDRIDVLILLKKAIEERIADEVAKGNKVVGWGIGAPTMGNRKYVDQGAILEYLKKGVNEGFLPFNVVEEIPLSPANLIKALPVKQYPDAREFVESQITRDLKDGTIQRMYDDPTVEDLPEISSLPTQPIGE